MSEEIILEITAERFHKFLAGITSLMFAGGTLPYWLSLFFPGTFSLQNIGTTPFGKTASFITAIIILFFAFWIWRNTVKYRSYVTEQGIGQTNGFRSVFITWGQVASYTLERIPQRNDKINEPVLRDCNGQVLMKPMVTVFVSSSKGKEQRQRFWQYVMDRIDKTGSFK